MDFTGFPKIARLSREAIITEKIDGTNAQVFIRAAVEGSVQHAIAMPRDDNNVQLAIFAGSRNRWITPADDNYGFARWVSEHATELVKLGVGAHFGEWWGQGIQRGYGLKENRFSLFNVNRWGPTRDVEKYPEDCPACCHVVPVLYSGVFSTEACETAIDDLGAHGSLAAPGFMRPEGIVVYHTAAGVMFKKTLEKDEAPKSKAA